MRFGIGYCLIATGFGIKEVKSARHGEDEPAAPAGGEAAEIFRCLIDAILARLRIEAVDIGSPYIDPPKHLLPGVPESPLAKDGLGVDHAFDVGHDVPSMIERCPGDRGIASPR